MTSQLSNLTEPDDLMDDIPGEVLVAGDTDKDPPEAIQSYWDSPYIVLTSDNGRWSWTCHHCSSSYKGKNASKAGKHLTGAGKQHIVVCKGAIPPVWQALYRDLAERMAEKRVSSTSTAAQFQRLQCRHDDASLEAVQKLKQARLSLSKVPTSSSANRSMSSASSSLGSVSLVRKPSAGIRSSTSLMSWSRSQTRTKPPPVGQMTIAAGLPNPSGNEIARNKVARYLIATNKPMSDCEDYLFQSMCLAFRNVDSSFKFPCRGTLTKQYLPAHANSPRDKSYADLKANASTFGIAIFGDGATIKRLPLINLLASSGTCPSALLEIVDCSCHMAKSGIKSAEYIARLMEPHVGRLGKEFVDLFLFDGASNVQKAGKLMAINYPRTSCFHSAEHLISLFLGDVCKLRPVQLLMKFYRVLYSYLGGSRHLLHAVFQKYTRAANQVSDMSLVLLKLCQLRMGGVFYCFLRMCRVKQPILDTLCCTEAIQANVPIGLKRILQDDDFWTVVVALLRFIAPVLHLLRISDRRDAGMDKLRYFSGRMVQYMVDNAGEINDLFGCMSTLHPDYPTSIWRKLDEFLNSNEAKDQRTHSSNTQAANDSDDDDSVSSVDSSSDDDSVGSVEEDDKLEAPDVPPHLQDTFVGGVLESWNQRKVYLEHSYAITGWFLSPAGPIMEEFLLFLFFY